jgi:hypothetical protein
MKGFPVDAAGAEKLRRRIEQQQNWRHAQAVLDGRQPSIDPDLADLEEFQDDLRLYSSRSTRDGAARVCKRLVDGFWESGVIEERLDLDDAPAAQVA